MSKRLLAISLVLGGAVVAMVVHDHPTRPRGLHDFDVSDFLEQDVRDRHASVHGTLVQGTLCRIEEPCGYRFALIDPLSHSPAPARLPNERALPVSFDGCSVPEPFLERPNQDHEVYVEGERCQSCHDFKATTILTRYDGKYDTREKPPLKEPPLCDALTPRL